MILSTHGIIFGGTLHDLVVQPTAAAAAAATAAAAAAAAVAALFPATVTPRVYRN